MNRKRFWFLCPALTGPALALTLAALLSGCIASPGREPFGEKTYSARDAQTVYEEFSEDFLARDFSRWDGYSMEIDTGGKTICYYRTEEYTAACAEAPEGEFLWYQGTLYRLSEEGVTYRDMRWKELPGDDLMAAALNYTQTLLRRRDAELTLKYIPMSEIGRQMLWADYPVTEWEDARLFSDFRVYFQDDGSYRRFYTSLQYSPKKDAESAANSVLMKISFFPWEGSTEVKAERKIWDFGRSSGLTQEPIPALSAQEKDREWARGIIDAMDFETLAERGVEQADLAMPELDEPVFGPK